MRVIAGTYRGRLIKPPAGLITRPTTDRVRESVFSSLASHMCGFEGAKTLDLFSGSGAMSIEAISRGAAHATMLDNSRAAIGVIRSNLDSLRIDKNRYFVMQKDSFLFSSQDAFDVVFADAPYAIEPIRILELAKRFSTRFFYYECDAKNKDLATSAFADVFGEPVYDKTISSSCALIFDARRLPN